MANRVFKHRRFWWTNPWVIAVAVGQFLVSVPMILWLATYKSVAAVVMFVITYLSLLVFLMIMVRRSLLEPHVYVDEKKIAEKEVELQAHRKRVGEQFVQTELEVLTRGETTPVLDVWRLDEKIQRRHPWFRAIDRIILDPVARELQIRIQLGELKWNAEEERNKLAVFQQVATFLSAAATEAHFQTLRDFFDAVVLGVYDLREDDTGRDVSRPIFSLLTSHEALTKIAGRMVLASAGLSGLGDFRFNNGQEVEPHRWIE